MSQKKLSLEEANRRYYDVIFLGALFLEKLDALKGTKKYNHQLKKYGNLFEKELEKTIGADSTFLYKASPVAYHNISDDLEKMVDLHVDDYVLITRLRDAYKEDPKKFRENFQFYFKELEDDNTES